jgi:hypothetical protein
LLSSDAGLDSAAISRRGAIAGDALRRTAGLRAAARFTDATTDRGAARRAVRFGVRFALRLAVRLTVFFRDAVRDVFLLDALRDFVAVFAVFRRFLAMRAPPGDWARILSDKLIARVSILRILSLLLVLAALPSPAVADQTDPAQSVPDARMPFERGTVEVSVIGGVSLPISTFRAKRDHQLAMASLAIGRVMAGAPGKGSLELLVDVTPFFQVRQPDLVRGWSVAPLFVRWNFPAIGGGAARVFGEVSGSLLFTTAPVPVRTTTFNFMDQAGFGIRFEESHGRAWLVGYRFQHISNAGRVKPNPGANFNFVYLGLSFIH